MAKYEHLPIYKKAYDFALYCEKVVRNFSRYHKYTLGTELREGSREIIRLIHAANDGDWIWTSDKWAEDPASSVWAVSFRYGFCVDHRVHVVSYVRAVRGGQLII